MHNQNVVSYSDGPAFDALVDSTLIPVLQSMVADSLILGWGFTDHAWCDEWNKNWWIITPSHSAFIAAWNDLFSRVSAQYPGAIAQSTSFLKRHKDNLFTIRDYNFSGPAGALMVQQHVVVPGKMSDWNDFMATKASPIFEQMMQEGLITGYGNLNHSWGDEWDGGHYLSADNVGAVLSGWQTFVERMNEAHPDWWNEAIQLIEIHKDNIYTIRVQG